MFQHKIDEVFKEFPNIFAIGDDNLIVGYGANSRDYDRAIRREMKICYK